MNARDAKTGIDHRAVLAGSGISNLVTSLNDFAGKRVEKTNSNRPRGDNKNCETSDKSIPDRGGRKGIKHQWRFCEPG